MMASNTMRAAAIAVAVTPAADDVAEPLHGFERRECRRLHDTGLLAQFALRQSVGFPQDAQKCPVSERDRMRREAHLQCAHERTRGVLDEMCEAVIWHRFLPMAQDRLCAGLRTRHGRTSHGT